MDTTTGVARTPTVPPGGIVTPEAVLLEFTTAGMATRILAKIIDLLIMAVGIVAIAIVAGLTSTVGSTTPTLIIWAVGVFAVVIVAPAATETFWNGRTPGKAVFGLRVVTTQGGPISFRHATIRGLIQVVEIPTGLGVFVALGNRKSQRLGDLAAGTFVINERLESSTVVPVQFVAPWGYENFTAQLDVGGVNNDQYLMVRNLLMRVNALSPDARRHLTVKTALAVGRSVRPSWNRQIHPEIYLISVAAACQRARGVFVSGNGR